MTKTLQEMSGEELLEAYDDMDWNEHQFSNSSEHGNRTREIHAELLRRLSNLVSLKAEEGWILCSTLPPKNPRNPANSIRVETYSPDIPHDEYRVGIGRYWFGSESWSDGVHGTPSHWRRPLPPAPAKPAEGQS